VQVAFKATRKIGTLSVERSVTDIKINRRSIPRCSTPRFLSARLLLSCGEASGDLYAGELTRELLALDPALTITAWAAASWPPAGGRLVDDYPISR